ncbi:pre-rRNA processing protein [Mucor velutinosus]|uniref:Pre-rRNA processing protein n=1 Tax=Mucor velutinosus TaxID=708070 RepID=A0AAN7I034_9FUNG|nr:pre-rRNA processing protein [Mucor velutinosus]
MFVSQDLNSIFAGYGIKNVPEGPLGLLNPNALTEYRGLNYMMGGDPDAISIASFIKHFNAKLLGSSTNTHPLVSIAGNVSYATHFPPVDNLNAAISGAMAVNLDLELDYLLQELNSPFASNLNAKNEWKMINIHIGSNEMCQSCDSKLTNLTTPEVYAREIENAVQRIKRSIPKTFVNLIGMFRFSVINQMAKANPQYCANRDIIKPCECFLQNKMDHMDSLMEQFNTKLMAIANKYAPQPGSTFGVAYTPFPIDFQSFPINAFSNIDCFHPSVSAHQWMAKSIWNQLFTKSKPSTMLFNFSEEIYCPTDIDRLAI